MSAETFPSCADWFRCETSAQLATASSKLDDDCMEVSAQRCVRAQRLRAELCGRGFVAEGQRQGQGAPSNDAIAWAKTTHTLKTTCSSDVASCRKEKVSLCLHRHTVNQDSFADELHPIDPSSLPHTCTMRTAESLLGSTAYRYPVRDEASTRWTDTALPTCWRRSAASAIVMSSANPSCEFQQQIPPSG
eukprot:2070929-Rhodomonas_salina.3